MNDLIFDALSITDINSISLILDSHFDCTWQEEQFYTEITSDSSYGFCIKLNDEILGFGVIKIILDECHILNISVKQDYRRKKIGTNLLDKLINEAKLFECKNIFLEVNIYNTPAINLYNKFGFEILSIRKDYYLNKQKNTKEDAYTMIKKI